MDGLLRTAVEFPDAFERQETLRQTARGEKFRTVEYGSGGLSRETRNRHIELVADLLCSTMNTR